MEVKLKLDQRREMVFQYIFHLEYGLDSDALQPMSAGVLKRELLHLMQDGWKIHTNVYF